MPRAPQKEHSLDLYKSIIKLKTTEECFNFFKDLCSNTELRSLEQRFDVARYLKAGDVYVDIMNKTKASSATISRVNRVLNDGTGELSKILDKTKKAKKETIGK